MQVFFGFCAGALVGGGAGFVAMLVWAELDDLAAITWPVGGAFVGALVGAVIAS